jgi:outer membrane lipoprotein-sorting protein
MHMGRKLFFAASMALLLLAARTASAAPADEKEKGRVLRRLDEAAKNFHSTTADFQFDSVETDPVPDRDIQKGTVYYERKGAAFQMGVHIREANGKPMPKIYTVSGGVFKLYEPLIDQVTTSTKVSKYESYLQMGFGAGGRDLEQKWEIKYLGPETLDGVKTEHLELTPKDPDVRKNLTKAEIWVDPERGVSLKQILYFGPTEYKVCVYFNIKVNQPLPVDAFTFKTTSKTHVISR